MQLKVADSQPATLLKMNFVISIFKDFDCKFENTYFPEQLSSGCFCRGIFSTIVNFKNQWWKRVLLNKNYERKRLNTRWCFKSRKQCYAKWCYLTYCWYWGHSEGCSSLSTELLLSSVNKNSTIISIYSILQLKDENEASYFYI